MAITPQIDNQLNTTTGIEQIPSKTYKLNDDILATKKEYLEPTVVESYESITIDDLGDPNIKLEAAGNSTQEVIAAVAGKTVSGLGSISVNDVDTTKEHLITPEGNSEQFTTQGNQLIDFSSTPDTSSSTTYSFVNDVVTVTSTTGTYKRAAFNILNLVKANAGKTLKFSYSNMTGGSNPNFNVQLRITNNGSTTYPSLITDNYVVPNDTSNLTECLFQIYSNNSSTSQAATTTITKPMLQFGTEEKAYEPYTGGQASPNPSYPQDINSVGDNVNLYKGSEDFSGTWQNSNSWETDSNTYNGLVVKKRNDAWFGLYKEINVEAGKTYTFSFFAKADETKTAKIYISNGTASYIVISLTADADLTTNWKRFSYIFNITASGTVRARVENSTASDTNYTYICGYKLEESSQETPYSPYNMGSIAIKKSNADNSQNKTYIIPTQAPFRKIGDVQDDFIKQNGTWYERHKIGRVVLDGSETNWQIITSGTYPLFYRDFSGYNRVAGITCKSNYYEAVSNIAGTSAIYSKNYKIALRYNTNDDYEQLYITDSRFNSRDDFKTWLSTHNTEVIYQLAEPTLTQCTAGQIAVLEEMTSDELYEITNITGYSGDIDANLKLKYNFITPAPSPDRESPIYSVADNNSINIIVSNEDETESQSFTITTQQPFRKIGDVFDDFVKTGDAWYERHKIGKITLDGSEATGWDFSNSQPNDTNLHSIAYNSLNTKLKGSQDLIINYFSSLGTGSAGPLIVNATHEGFWASNNTSSHQIGFITDARTVADFKTWLSTHNIDVYYVLAEPTLTPCTSTQAEQLEALQNILLTQTPVIINSNDATFPRLKLTYYSKDDVRFITVQADRIIGYVDNIEAVKQAIYHILMTERYANLIYDENYGVELEQYIGADLEYIQTTIEETLREALTYDLRILDVKVTSVENIEKDLVLVKFNAYTIYGDLNMEVNINV